MIKDKHYFVADTHLGVPNYEESLIREKALVRFLLEAEKDAKAIYLLGDIFDFWHEYKLVVPKFYVRLLGTLASIVDRGTEVHFFTGNHDQWIGDYFEKEI
ncbi:MAG: metallophosphoesterase, partial [Bacteroidales bacterium]|nr:metallophosphoesterase [Bacteroidales bacterium]